jgi:hypothetical protein
MTEAEGESHAQVARAAVGSHGEGVRPARLGASDIAAALKSAGVALERVDPGQLRAAARFVSGARSAAEQRERLRLALDAFRVLGRIGLPRLPREQMVRQLWSLAGLPSHVLRKLSDVDIRRKFQDVAAVLNDGAGRAEIDIAEHDLRLEVGDDGVLLASSFRKPGFLSKMWGTVRKAAN